jgi:hypothetical protein
MQQSPWEANRSSTSKEVLCILWNPVSSLLHSQEPSTCSYHTTSPRLPEMCRNMKSFYCENLLVPCATPKLEDHPLSAVGKCSFNIFAAAVHTGGSSSIRSLRMRHVVVTETHLSWFCFRYVATNQHIEICSTALFVIVIQMLRIR